MKECTDSLRWFLAIAALVACGIFETETKAATYDIGLGFSATANPNGVWSYGWVGSIGGPFRLNSVPGLVGSENGVPVPYWALTSGQLPAVYCNVSATTAIFGGGHGSMEQREIWWYPGEDFRPENLGVIRFTVPQNGAGNYKLEVRVGPDYDTTWQLDSDFHVVTNGVELFSKALGPTEVTGYTNEVILDAGDTVDFDVGRGHHLNSNRSGLAIHGQLTLLWTNPAPRAVKVLDVNIPKGQTNIVSVRLEAQGDENALSFSLIFDPTILTMMGAVAGSGASGATLLTNTNEVNLGRVGLALALSPGSTFSAGTRELIRLKFAAVGADLANTTVSFGDQPILRETVDKTALLSLETTYTPGTISLTMPQGPPVSFNRSGSTLLFSWPANNGYDLETTTGGLGSTWIPVTGVIQLGDQKIYPATIGSGEKYYRLMKP